MTLTDAFSKLLHEGRSVKDVAKEVVTAYASLVADIKDENLYSVRSSAKELQELVGELDKLTTALVKKSKDLTHTTKKNTFIDLSIPADKRK